MALLTTSERLTDWTAAIGWRLSFANFLTPRYPVVLMYHGIPRCAEDSWVDAASFEHHVRFLKDNFEIISPDRRESRNSIRNRVQTLLTFDDGFKNNAEIVAPILRRHRVPALFFVSSRHSKEGRYLWFTYLRILAAHFKHNSFVFRDEVLDMSRQARPRTISRLIRILLDLKPHPQAMYEAIENELPPLSEFVSPEAADEQGAGMTEDQVQELAQDELFHFGAHTVDHPLLSRCEEPEALRQIHENKLWLEHATKRPCDAIAYPMQDYDRQVVRLCKQLGFRQGYSVTRTLNLDSAFEIPRVGVYRKSLNRLGLKVRWATLFC
jgi:peptidoglycan/xylan/chitin deacetylase (PgdA/CDA1 family)